MARTQALYNVLLLVPSVLAHMEMSWPYPIHSKFDPSNHGTDVDWSMTSPLEADGSNFPCKGYQNSAMHNVATYTPGQRYNISLAGSAPHMGGSCQISLSYDHGATFRVIKSMIGGCPMTHDYDFTIPSFAPPGDALLAWTWQNSEGNREFYMNCAAVQVEAGSAAPPSSAERRRQAKRRGDSFNTFEDLPFIWKANLPSVSDCTTVEKETPVYPEPGPEVQYGADMTKESVVTPGDCSLSQPYGRTYKPIAQDSLDAPKADLKRRSDGYVVQPNSNSSEAAAPASVQDAAPAPAQDAAPAMTPAPSTEQKDGLLGSLGDGSLGSLLGLGSGSRSVHTVYTVTGDASLDPAQAASLASIQSEASAIMSAVAPLLSLRDMEMTAVEQATPMPTMTDAAMNTMTDAAMTSKTSKTTSMVTSMTDAEMTTMMTMFTTLTMTVTAPGSTITTTSSNDGLLGGLLGTGGILRRDTSAQAAPTVDRAGLLGPLLGMAESAVFPNQAIDTTVVYNPQATQNGGIQPQIGGIGGLGGLGGVLRRAVDANPTMPMAMPAMSAAATTSVPIPLIAEPILGLASILVREESATAAMDAQTTQLPTDEKAILSGSALDSLNKLLGANILKREPEASPTMAAAPSATTSSGDLLDSLDLNKLLGGDVLKREQDGASPTMPVAPSTTTPSGDLLGSLDDINKLLGASILKREEDAASPTMAAAPSSATSSANLLDSLDLNKLLGEANILKREDEASPTMAAAPSSTTSSGDFLDPIMSLLGVKWGDGLRIGNSSPKQTMEVQVRRSAPTAPAERAEDASPSDVSASPSTTTVTVDCPQQTFTVYVTASSYSTLTITSTTADSSSQYTTSAGSGACTGTSALCPCAPGYQCLDQGSCTWVCLAQPSTSGSLIMTVTSTPSSVYAAPTTSTTSSATSYTPAPASTPLPSNQMPMQTPQATAHPAYASASNPNAYLPCVPGTFLCTSESTWVTCDVDASSDWVYSYPRNVSAGMECITFISPYSSSTSTYAQQAMTPEDYYRDDRIVRARPDGDCSDDGSIMCTDNGQMFDICDQGGWVEMGAVAAGTMCLNGQIVASS